jgi:hypothetical protein
MVEGQEVVEGDDGGDVAECAGECDGERTQLPPDRKPTAGSAAGVPSVDPWPFATGQQMAVHDREDWPHLRSVACSLFQ